jgi:hypothetical protein
MKKIASALVLLVLFPLSQVYSSTEDLDALVESVRQEALQEASHDQERIERFLSEREAQTQLLNDARQRLTEENNRADRLRNSYENNELTLTQYEADLMTCLPSFVKLPLTQTVFSRLHSWRPSRRASLHSCSILVKASENPPSMIFDKCGR